MLCIKILGKYMKVDYNKHIVITELTKHAIGNMKVVLPVDYGKFYRKFSAEMDVELSPEELLSHEMLDEKVVRHILTLTQCTQEALEAMQTNDAMKLQRIMEETQKLRIEVEELQKLVYTDTLTHCYNRKWFEDHFLDSDNKYFSQSGTLVMVDLNRFKRINDDYGHSIGDRVLVFIAKKLKEITPQVVRYGGDEFLLNFDTSLSKEKIENKMAKLFHEIEQIKFKVVEIEFKISFAYGVCAYTIDNTFIEILDQADKSMYNFKKDQKNKP